MTNSDRLTQLELNFINDYVVNGNATRAYLKVRPDVTEGTASAESTRLLGLPKVQAHLKKIRDEMSFRTEITIDKIVHETAIIAFSDINEVIDFDGEKLALKDLRSLPRHITSSIKKIKNGRDGIQIELHDKNTALDRLAKIYGLYTDLNQAIATLRKYGKQVIIDGNDWSIQNIEPE